MVGGQERTWVRPLRARSLAQARVRRRAEGERRRAPAQCRPVWPPSACLYGRAPTASRTGPGAPAEGARAAPREGGRGGGGGKMRAQSAVRGGGTVERPPSCLPLLTCVLGGVRTTPPSRRGGGRAPSLPPPSRPLNPPEARGYCHRLASTASSHGTEMREVGGENGRRYSQRTAAAASEASPKWPPPSRPPPPTPPPPPQLTIATAGAARPLARQ